MENNNTRLYQLLRTFDRADENEQKKVVEEIRNLAGRQAAPSLIHILKNDEDYSQRVKAAHVLGELGDRQAIEPLIEAFKDNPIWPNAVEALAKFNDPSLIEIMIASMDTPAIGMSHGTALKRVIRVILSFGEPAFQALLKHLDEPALREQVAQALGMSRDQRAVEPLIKLLDDPATGPVSARALAEIGDVRAVEPLIKLFQIGSTENQRETAAWALGELKDQRGFAALKQALNAPDQSDTVRSSAAKALGQAGNNAIPALLNALTDQSIQFGVASGLAATEQTQPLIEALNNPNSQMRAGAAMALGMVGSTRSNSPLGAAYAPVESLIGALKDNDVNVKKNAIWAIFHIVTQLSINSILLAENRGKISGMTPEKTLFLQGQIAKLNREALIEPIITALQDESDEVRSQAAMVLGQLKIKDNRTLKALALALKDPAADVCFRAKEALIWMEATDEDIKDF